MNLRLRFSRKGPVKYLGHLDMMRYFQKALLRANIDMKYSEGFNPHQIMSFAYPLGVSMETVGDYMDIEVNSYDSLEDVTNRMNNVMHEGISIISTSLIPDGELNAMASVSAASYEVEISEKLLTDEVNDFLSQDEIMILREAKNSDQNKSGKKGKKVKAASPKDIKAGIYDIKIIGDNKLSMFLQSGSSLNVKPIDVINAISDFTAKEIKINSILRTDIYRMNQDMKLVSLNCFD